jgi:hypothetical protein
VKSKFEFTGLNGFVDSFDAAAGDVCYKDGAATNYTARKSGLAEATVFIKGTDKASPAIDHAECVTFHGIEKHTSIRR